jgi:DNA-binding response OmpR family regulator
LMANNRRILIVEDDEILRDTLADHLVDLGGFTIVHAGSLAQAEAAIRLEDGRPDAIILDVGLPDGDGCDFCVRLRKSGFNMPIIILTGSSGEEDIVRGLEAGASDYIAKPFSPAELTARLHAQLRSFDRSEDAAFTIGPFAFYPSKKLLRNPDKKQTIHLTDKEVSVLKFLLRSNGPVDRKVLLAEVWGYNSGVTTHTLETHIYRLRQKLEADPSNPVILTTHEHAYGLQREFL